MPNIPLDTLTQHINNYSPEKLGLSLDDTKSIYQLRRALRNIDGVLLKKYHAHKLDNPDKAELYARASIGVGRARNALYEAMWYEAGADNIEGEA